MSKSPRLDDLLPYLLNRLVATLNQNLGEELRRKGYTFQEWRILAVLAAHDGITLSQLAEAAVIPQPTVSRLVAQLARRGFLHRRPGARDGRLIEIRLTSAGRAAYNRMLPLAVAEFRSAVAGFDKAETDWLRRAALQMITNKGITLLPAKGRPPSRLRASKPSRMSLPAPTKGNGLRPD
jgi:DNA-binding MarR family transcriptional regulator